MPKAAGGGGDGAVTSLLGDDAASHAFLVELSGVHAPHLFGGGYKEENNSCRNGAAVSDRLSRQVESTVKEALILWGSWIALIAICAGVALVVASFVLRDRRNQVVYDWMTSFWVYLGTRLPVVVSRQSARRFRRTTDWIFGSALFSVRCFVLGWWLGAFCWLVFQVSIHTIPDQFLAGWMGARIDATQAPLNIRQAVGWVHQQRQAGNPTVFTTLDEMAQWPGVFVPLLENTRYAKILLNDFMVFVVCPWFAMLAFAFTRWTSRAIVEVKTVRAWVLIWLAALSFALMAAFASLITANLLGDWLAPNGQEILLFNEFPVSHGAILCGMVPLLPFGLHTLFFATAAIFALLNFVFTSLREAIELIDESRSWPLAVLGGALVTTAILAFTVVQILETI